MFELKKMQFQRSLCLFCQGAIFHDHCEVMVVDLGEFMLGILRHMAFDFVKAKWMQDQEIVEEVDMGDHNIGCLHTMAGCQIHNGFVDHLAL